MLGVFLNNNGWPEGRNAWMRAVKMLMYPSTLRVLALYSNKFEGNLNNHGYFFSSLSSYKTLTESYCVTTQAISQTESQYIFSAPIFLNSFNIY